MSFVGGECGSYPPVIYSHVNSFYSSLMRNVLQQQTARKRCELDNCQDAFQNLSSIFESLDPLG